MPDEIPKELSNAATATMGAIEYFKRMSYPYLIGLCALLILGYGVIGYILIQNAKKSKVFTEQKEGLEKIIVDQTMQLDRLRAENSIKQLEANRTAANYAKTTNAIDLSIFSNRDWQSLVSKRKTALGLP